MPTEITTTTTTDTLPAQLSTADRLHTLATGDISKLQAISIILDVVLESLTLCCAALHQRAEHKLRFKR